ncbi:adaptor protein MecA [Sporosarcina sp. G11-34]|uniref:adaptor protein MecA n=1 Tax=Sporosarcina sp. G11-34 TaxID=2849605 RepID=UPI0022A9F096|nr:adaptor protein MecA [Sporosarcina sp. G11-34]MCZ2258989.1 adaptor protein MecA [Sporosarcina sp. G11-34]
MEIERINENTVKFFLSYKDIEDRGFTREEVWYNRDKSEELFWEMMDEINEESEFEVEGPLWIQVHAMSDGIEVTVTRASEGEDGQISESPFTNSDQSSKFQPDIEIFTDEDTLSDGLNGAREWLDSAFCFKEFDDLILLSSRVQGYDVKTSLYLFEGKYYLHVVYDSEVMDDNRKTDYFNVLTEFATPSNVTIHRLEEYGKVIMDSDVFKQIDKYF